MSCMKSGLLVVVLAMLAPVDAVFAAEKEGAADPNKARLEFSGKIQLDYIYDFKRVDPAWNATLRPSTICFDGSCGQNGESIFSMRQTSLGFSGFIPTSVGELKTDVSFDLFGVGGGSTQIRLLNAWAELGKFGIGQSYSLFMNADTFPNIIDYWGPNGMVYLRNPQVRYTPYDSGDGVKVAFSLEAPNAAIDTGKATDVYPELSAQGRAKWPDLIGKVSVDRDWGQFQAAGIIRYLGYEVIGAGTSASSAKTGWGVNLNGWLKTYDKNRIVGQIAFGEGIASYINDGGVDIAPNAALRAEAVKSIGAFVYYDHYWSERWSSAFGLSTHRQDNTGGQNGNAFRQGSYASSNLLWYPAKNVLAGAEFLWGRLEQKDGKAGDDTRIQFSGQYKF
jgi:hypothetical protein